MNESTNRTGRADEPTVEPATRNWRRHWRWVVPGAVAAVVVGGVGVAGLAAGASGPLPPRTAEELLTQVQTAQVDGLSGTVVQTSNLGLPDLNVMSGSGRGGDTGLASSLTGTHTWRVWYGGQDKARLALIAGDGETDIIRNGKDVWTWDSATSSASHLTLPDEDRSTHPDLTRPTAAASPQETASELLKAIEPSTVVTTDGTGTVAGRPVYELVLVPKTDDTLVKQVRIAVDAEEGVPLRVQVLSTRTSDPAFEVGFTSVDFSVPQDRQFQFTPPSGTEVTEVSEDSGGLFGATTADDSGSPAQPATQDPTTPDPATHNPANEPTIVGEGWSTVVVGQLSADELAAAQSGSTEDRATPARGPGSDGPQSPSALIEGLPQVSGAWGSGRVLEGTLFTVILTDDGRYAVGAVPAATLEAALTR